MRATFYLPSAQTAQRLLDAVVVRTTGDPRDQLSAVRRIVADQDPTLAIARADRLFDLVDATLVAERFRTLLLAVFAGTAVLLAGIGIVGVTTNAAARRKRELAIRMAVGARPAVVIRTAMTGTLTVALAGAISGAAIALFVDARPAPVPLRYLVRGPADLRDRTLYDHCHRRDCHLDSRTARKPRAIRWFEEDGSNVRRR